MRRLIIALFVSALVISFADRADAAAVPVAGTFTGTGSFESGGPCSFIHQFAALDANIDAVGVSTIDLELCVEPAPLDFPVDGTFTLASAVGAMAGGVTGSVQAGGPGPEFPFHFVLSIVSGTAAFDGATGNLVLDGSFGIGAATAHGTISGTVELPSRTPSTKDDCKRGQWRDLVDSQGRPFPDQGQCIRSVVRRAG